MDCADSACPFSLNAELSFAYSFQPVCCFPDGWMTASSILPASCTMPRFDSPRTHNLRFKCDNVIILHFILKTAYLWLDKAGNLVPRVFAGFFQVYYQEIWQGQSKEPQLIWGRKPVLQSSKIALFFSFFNHWTVFLKNSLKTSHSRHPGDIFICNIKDSQEKNHNSATNVPLKIERSENLLNLMTRM